MCIICNISDLYSKEPDKFLNHFSQANSQMKKAADALLATIPIVPDAERKKQYKKVHKVMVRLNREWNNLEHKREIKHD